MSLLNKYYSPDPGGGGDKPPTQPANYKTLSPQERQQWNDFLDYLDKQGVGGKDILDKRDQTLGNIYMAKYKQANPSFSITPDRIPSIQYDQYQLRKGDSFPGVTADQLAFMRNGLSQAYKNRATSPIDGWLGSVTSRLYYPTATRVTNTGERYSFGTHIEDYVNSLNDSKLQEKYRVK